MIIDSDLIEKFRSRFQEFYLVAAWQIEGALEDALLVAGNAFGDARERAVFLVAAHTLKSSPLQTDDGEAIDSRVIQTIEVADEISVTYDVSGSKANVHQTSTGYDSTSYGREFIQLKRSRIFGLMST